ncbi:MAG TPA: hypothetical protein VEJ18_13740 [Planctomycetota bacterium]|nr:hypothetical protein [Planctomycetota bacterium]
MNRAPAGEPLHERVAGVLEWICNPILVKELRGSLRGARFFVAFIVVLALVAASLLVTFAAAMGRTGYGHAEDASSIGRTVLMVLQFLELGVVFLIVPGLAATSLTTERESLTHELLVTTTLNARQIVWGKFSAAMAQTLTVLMAMLPLIGLCFLFGGVTVYQILANYAFLVLLSALIVAFALFVSAQAGSTQIAVGSVYGLSFVGGAISLLVLGSVVRYSDAAEAFEAYGFVTEGRRWPGAGFTPAQTVLYVYALPGFLWAALFSLFFISAVNRLKPLFANRSTNVRLHAVAVTLGALALTRWIWEDAVRPGLPPGSYVEALMAILTATCGVVLLLSLFACEETVIPAHLRARAEAWRGLRRAGRLLWPGAASGAAFTVVLTLVLCALLAVLFGPYARGLARGVWTGAPGWLPFAAALTAVVCWSLLCATLGRWLSAVLPHRPVLVRVIHVLGTIVLTLAPLLHWAVATEIQGNRSPGGISGPWSLHLSPVAAVLGALDVSRDFPFKALGIPLPLGFPIFALLVSAALHGMARRRSPKS